MNVAFLICVERGRLEDQAKLLCRSIRRFGGAYRNASIYTFQPRRGTQVADATLDVLRGFNATHITQPLNTDFHDYAIGNKMFVCAWAEEMLSEEVLVFLDSDTIMVGEPADLDLSATIDAAVRPAHSRDLNSSGPGHAMDEFWLRVYRILGITNEAYVETEFGNRVRAYFSAGLIAARRRAGLFRQWKADFLQLVRANHIPSPAGLRRMDEVALAATMLRAFPRIRILDERYNYLIFKRHQLPAPWSAIQLDELVHVHYRGAFGACEFLRDVQPPLDPSGNIVRWLADYLPLPSDVEPGDITG